MKIRTQHASNKRPFYVIRLLALLAAFALLLGSAGTASARARTTAVDARTGQEETPLEINVSLSLLNVRSFSLDTGDYAADFLLLFECNQPCEVEGNFNVLNGWIDEITPVDQHDDRHIYRVRASLSADVQVRYYPFDTHRLPIVLEFGEELEAAYALGPHNNFAPNLMISGYEMHPTPQVAIEALHNPLLGETRDTFSFTAEIHRAFVASLTLMLPPLFFVLIGLASLIVRPHIVLINGVLLGTIFYHIHLNEQIPAISQLTFAEIFMMINYIALSPALVAAMFYERGTNEAKENRVRKISRYPIPLIWLVLQIINIVYMTYALL